MARIFVADDYPANLTAIRDGLDMLTDSAHEIVTFPNGRDALAAVENGTQPFDLGITDFEMGTFQPDGVDVAIAAVRRGVGLVFINTNYVLEQDTVEAEKLRFAQKNPNIKVVKKMDLVALETLVVPHLK